MSLKKTIEELEQDLRQAKIDYSNSFPRNVKKRDRFRKSSDLNIYYKIKRLQRKINQRKQKEQSRKYYDERQKRDLGTNPKG